MAKHIFHQWYNLTPNSKSFCRGKMLKCLSCFLVTVTGKVRWVVIRFCYQQMPVLAQMLAGEGCESVAVSVHWRDGSGAAAGWLTNCRRDGWRRVCENVIDHFTRERSSRFALKSRSAAEGKSYQISFSTWRAATFPVTLVVRVEETVAAEVWSNWLLEGKREAEADLRGGAVVSAH